MATARQKKYEKNALLERKILSTLRSRFVLDCAYSFVDGADLV